MGGVRIVESQGEGGVEGGSRASWFGEGEGERFGEGEDDDDF